MYGDPKDIIISFMAGHGIRDAMMFPAEFGSSWDPRIPANASSCIVLRLGQNTSCSQACVLMGFLGGLRAPLITFPLWTRPLCFQMVFDHMRLIKVALCMAPLFPFN